jgi:tetratricopeptide (TPR) repeat protein
MKLKWTSFSSLFITCLLSSLAFAAEQKPAQEIIIKTDKIYDPDQISVDSLNDYEQKFNFDWRDYSTLSLSQKKLNDIESFLKHPLNLGALSEANKQALGKILYKLGTYYTNIALQLDHAIDRLKQADALLQNQAEKTRIRHQLAYAFALKFSLTHDKKQRQRAINYINQAKRNTLLDKHEDAFGYFVQGKIEYEANNFGYAEDYLRKALATYEKLAEVNNDAYARTQTLLAKVLLRINGREQEALELSENAHQYWLAKSGDTHNVYAARNLMALGEANFKTGNINLAYDDFKQAIPILQQAYGDNSPWLAKPYQLLADTYEKAGNTKLSAEYHAKAIKALKG